MKRFKDYVDLKELAAYDVGASLLGKSSLDSDSEAALTAAMEAFEMIMSRNSQEAARWLNGMAQKMPDLKEILDKHGLASFTDSDFKSDMRRGATKGRKFISKGLADVSADDVKDYGTDVLATNSADSFHNPV